MIAYTLTFNFVMKSKLWKVASWGVCKEGMSPMLVKKCIPKCYCNYENYSKSHIGRYEIIDSKQYNQPRVVKTQTKLEQNLDHFTVF